MLRTPLLHLARRHLRWLLCFALLLPVAQWASVAHAFTHAADSAGRVAPEPGAHLQHCPVCPAAAAVAAGGMACGAAGIGHALRVAAGAIAAPAPLAIVLLGRRPSNRGPPLHLA